MAWLLVLKLFCFNWDMSSDTCNYKVVPHYIYRVYALKETGKER